MKNDINTAEDIDRLLVGFYDKAVSDSIIGFIFTDIAKINLQKHLPIISLFWQQHILGLSGYQGRPFETHRKLHRQSELTEHHFHRWLFLFKQEIQKNFSGPRSEMLISKAEAIADSMLKGLQDRHMQEIMVQREHKGVRLFNPEEP